MIRYYLSEAFNSFRNTKVFSFFSILTLSLSICLIVCAGLLFLTSSKIEEKLKNKIEVIVFLEDQISSEVRNDLKDKILSYPIVEKAVFYSKEKALEIFSQQTGQNIIGLIDTNPLPAYYSISFNLNVDEYSILEMKNTISSYASVTDVVMDHDVVIGILSTLNSAKIFIVGLSIIFSMISIYLIYFSSKLYLLHNTIKFNTMKFVGASLSTLKIPLLLRGLIIGILAAASSIILTSVILITVQSFTHQNIFVPSLYFINFVILLLGLILGPIGTGIFNKRISLKITSK